MNEKRYLLLFAFIFMLIIVPCFASTETGELGTGNFDQQISLSVTEKRIDPIVSAAETYRIFLNTNIKNQQFMMVSGADNSTDLHVGSALDSASIDATVKINGTTIGHGTWGFNRNYATSPAYIQIWFEWDDLDLSGFSGSQYATLYFSNGTALNYTNAYAVLSYKYQNQPNAEYYYLFDSVSPCPALFMSGTNIRFIPVYNSIDYYYRYLYKFRNYWIAEQDDTTSKITINVYKNVGGVTYNSKVYVLDQYDNIIWNELAISGTDQEYATFTTPVKIRVQNALFMNYTTSKLFSAELKDYMLHLNTTNAMIDEHVKAELISYGDSNLSELKQVIYTYSGSDLVVHLMENLTDNSLKSSFTKISNSWYQYDSDTSYFSNPISTPPDEVVFSLTNAGNYTITASYITTFNQAEQTTENLTIIGTGYRKNIFNWLDADLGGYIDNVPYQIFNANSNKWTNGTAFTGTLEYYGNTGDSLIIHQTPTGYADKTTTTNIWGEDYTANPSGIHNIYLLPTSTKAGLVASYWTVLEYQNGVLGAPISGATITILKNVSGGFEDYDISTTSAYGTAKIYLLNYTAYKAYISKTGYVTSVKIFETTYDGAISYTIGLQPVSNIPTLTTAQTTTQITTIGGYAGNIGGGNISPASCSVTLPAGATFIDALKRNLACAGITKGDMQGYALACMVICVCMLFGGRYGKGLGVAFGAGAGYVISLGMGLVPLWSFFALLVIAGLIFAVKIWRTSNND